MPREGFKAITVSQDTFDKLSRLAEKENRSIPETITELLKIGETKP